MPTSANLFGLPGELRNTVYKHVLSSPAPLLLVMGNAGVPIITSQDCDEFPREFNKLQYVNKQMNLETSDMESRANDIKVPRVQEEDETPGVFFLIWVGLMTSKQLAWLDGCTIILADEYYAQLGDQGAGHEYGYMSESAKTISSLAKFCNRNPGVKLDYLLPFLDLSQDLLHRNTFFVMLDTAYTYIDRLVTNNMDDNVWPFNDVDLQWGVVFWPSHSDSRYVSLEELQASNLRFKPCGVGNKGVLLYRLRTIFGEGSVQCATILRWVEDGL